MIESYKKGEIGRIPKDWEEKKLGEVASFSQGYQVGVDNQKNAPENGYVRFVRIIDYTQNNTNDIRFVKDPGKRYFAKKSDIIMVRYGTPGVIGRGIEGVIANNLFKISFNKSILNDFAEQYFKYPKTFKRISEGSGSSTMPAINFSFLKNFSVVIPPLPEQQKIAEILSTVDEKIEVIGEQISQTQELKRGLMQRLLTKGIGHTKFKDSPLGKISESWDVVKLLEVGSLTGGYAFKASKFNDIGEGYQVVRMSNIQPYGLELNKNPVFLSSINANEERFILKRGDVIITLTGTVGKTDYGNVAHINKLGKLVLNQRVGRFQYNDKIDSKFLFFIFSSEDFRKQFFERGKGGTGNQANVGKDGFESIEIRLPPLPEQEKIAEVLSTVDEKVGILKDKKQQYQNLKQGLMQQLLSGKIRVTNLLTKAVPA